MLRTAKLKAFAASQTLQTYLEQQMLALHAQAEAGKILTSAGAGDVNKSDTLLPGVNPAYRAEGYEQLLELLTKAQANLVARSASSTDDIALFNEMLGLLAPVYESRGDFSQVGL